MCRCACIGMANGLEVIRCIEVPHLVIWGVGVYFVPLLSQQSPPSTPSSCSPALSCSPANHYSLPLLTPFTSAPTCYQPVLVPHAGSDCPQCITTALCHPALCVNTSHRLEASKRCMHRICCSSCCCPHTHTVIELCRLSCTVCRRYGVHVEMCGWAAFHVLMLWVQCLHLNPGHMSIIHKPSVVGPAGVLLQAVRYNSTGSHVLMCSGVG
jgi:hypothetical protein